MSIHSLIGIKLKDRFKLCDLVGSGGFSSVYLARDEQSGRVVAVKILHGHLATSPEILVRFHGELRKAQKLRQANVVEYYEEGVDQGLHYLVMEFLGGQTLTLVLQRRGALVLEETLSITSQTADTRL